MGAISPLCPYQSAASRALRSTGSLFSLPWWRRLLRTVIELAVLKPSQFILKVPDVVRSRRSSRNVSAGLELVRHTFATTLRESGTPEEAVAAQAARWLLGTTSNRGDQVAAAQFICTIKSTAGAPAVEDPSTWRHLISLTREAFNTWHSQPNARTRELAELFGLASCRVLLRFSNDTDKRKGLTDLLLYQPRDFGGTFWQAFEFASTRYRYYIPEDAEYILQVALFATILSKGSVISEYQWHELSRFFSTGTHHKVDVPLGMWAICLCNVGSDRSPSRAVVDLMEVGKNNSILVQNLWDAIASSSRILPLVQGDLRFELNIARGYRYCLRRALELSPLISPQEKNRAAHHAADLILSFIDPLASSDSGKSSSEVGRLSTEAVFGLHDLIMSYPCTNYISISQDSRPEQLLNGHLINAVVGMMLDGLKGLASPELLQVEIERLWEGLGRLERLERLEWLEQVERVERVEGLATAPTRVRALALERVLERALAQAVVRWHGLGMWWRGSAAVAAAAGRALQLLIESCLIRILLRVWKMTPVTQLDHSASHNIFTSSCQLWAPLETTVDLTKNGINFGDTGELLEGFNDDNQDKLFTSNDLEMIVEFVEYLQKDREKSAFIARNADVGINRLYVHLDRQEDWDYELYDLRAPRSLCSRSIENGMVSACSVAFYM